MKTKAQRKAARWARKEALKRVQNQYGKRLWFRELVASHGTRTASRMALDAETRPSFEDTDNCCHGGVVMWSETKYADRWCYTDYIIS